MRPAIDWDIGMQEKVQTRSVTRTISAELVPIVVILWLGYSAIGIPLATLPLQVHEALGFSTTIVGVAVGLSAAATLLSRPLAGRLSERNGPKPTVLLGLAAVTVGGLAYLTSLEFGSWLAYSVLVIGRLLLGFGESLLTTSALSWAVMRVGLPHAGKAMAWVGIAMFGALATGAPVGAALGAQEGFWAVSVAAAVAPLLAVPVVLSLPSQKQAVAHRKPSVAQVVRAVWLPGLSMILGSSGYGAAAAFLPLLYASSSWDGAGVAMSAFSIAYILARLAFGGLPDRFGGSWTAVGALCVQAIGLSLIALAPNDKVALAGAFTTGFGYSLVFPSLGLEVVRRASSIIRASAISAFLACFDVGVGSAGPVYGMIADARSLRVVFLVAAAAGMLSIILVTLEPLVGGRQSGDGS